MIRLFSAIAVPEPIGEGLMRRQQGLSDAAWRPLEAFHITLRFFGEVREDVAADLDSELATAAGRPFDLSLAGVGSFGEGHDIHAVWAGVVEAPELSRLAARNETAARRAGLKADTRSYKPHVTLAYLKRPSPIDVAHWIQEHNLLKSPAFRVDRFGLYSSWQTPEGSRYRLEAQYLLS